MLKIKEIQITKLFDVFDHQIPLNESGLTLMLGENGFGKTILLKMVKALFQKDFEFIEQVIFNQLIIIFSDGTKWLTQKLKGKNNKLKIGIKKYFNEEEIEDSLIIIASEYDEFVITEESLQLSTYNKIEKKYIRDEEPIWFTETLEKINISFIETQRLLIKVDRPNVFLGETQEYRETIVELSEDLVSQIQSRLAKSTELASKLDRTYPSRLAEKRNSFQNIEKSELLIELEKLENKRTILQKVGLIEKAEDTGFQYNGDTDEFMKTVLMVYIDDSNKKLAIFDDLANRIKLFKNIINKRFLYKKLNIDKEKGFIFKSKITGKEIPLTGLSSGEQHEIVLFFTLLFKIQPNTLILIDEPEISLHISWQNNFIDDLKEVVKLTEINILIATHSPNIIGNYWDITTELKRLDASLIDETDD